MCVNFIIYNNMFYYYLLQFFFFKVIKVYKRLYSVVGFKLMWQKEEMVGGIIDKIPYIYFTDQGLEIPGYLYYLLTMVLT